MEGFGHLADNTAVGGRNAQSVAQTTLISVQELKKTFGGQRDKVLALDKVTFDVKQGEFLSIVGASGCGKSTLLRILAGLILPSEGTVLMDGKAVDRPVREIGMVFQDPLLLPWRSVISNVTLAADILHLDKRDLSTKASTLINLVGLEGFERNLPFQLSGGMQQRVSLCRALLNDPKILLMDEPFGALDAMTRDAMNLLLLGIWERTKTTIVFVTHSISEALFLSDRVVVMTPRPGRVDSIVKTDLPRPRDLSIQATEPFGRLAEQIRQRISSNTTHV